MVWSQELVDSALGVFPTTSIGLIQDGMRPAIAYDYGAKQELHYAVRNGSTWDIEVIDSLGLFVPSVNFDGGRMTVAYTNLNVPPDRGLRFAEKIGGTWKIQDVHPHTVGPALSTASGPDGRRVVAFEAYRTGLLGVLHGLLFARETASGWNVSAIDSGESGIGSISVARSNGTYAVAYATLDANYTTHAKLALGDGLTWRVLEVATDVQVGYTSIFATFDMPGALHLFFARFANDTLVHRYQNGTSWVEEVVDNGTRPGDIGVHMSATTGPDGEPRLVYLVSDVYRLVYAVRGKSGWAYSEIDRNTNRGFFPSLAVDSSNRPHVAFIDAGFPPSTEDLWYATASPRSANRPPEPRVTVSEPGLEGAPVQFDASNSSDPDGDPLRYRWDFTADGTWDTEWAADPTASYTYGDDLSGSARVEVNDGLFRETAEASVAVANVGPSASVSIVPCTGDDDDDEDDDEEGRDEDDGDDDEGDEEADGDDGASEEGCGRGEEEGSERVFFVAAVATDPGSDDLTFTWSGDCTGFTSPVTNYSDPALQPDPDPSIEVNPRNVTNTQKILCGGGGGTGDDDDDEDDDDDDGDDGDDEDAGPPTFSWQLVVEDDDGGMTIVSGTITIDDDDDDDDGDEDD